MRVGSLFAGIGGFDLAARWMGWETIWYSEIDPYASAVMKKNFPTALNLGDITQIDGKQAPPVDLLCGGFPCQDISLAGKGAGLSGERSGLWSHYARLIEEIRPRYVVIENVSALRSRGLDRVLGEIAALGYDAEWHCIPAAYVGAPHRRDRVWIVAYPSSPRSLPASLTAIHSGEESTGARHGQSERLCGSRVERTLADANSCSSQSLGTTGQVVSAPRADEGEGQERQRVRNASDSSSENVADSAGQPESESRYETETERDRWNSRLVTRGSGVGLAVSETISPVACDEPPPGFTGPLPRLGIGRTGLQSPVRMCQ